MSDPKENMEQMMKFWQDGQSAFFSAQKEMAENFANAFAPKPKDPMAASMEAWRDFVKAWAPGWDPAAMMASSVEKSMDKQREAFFALFDPSNWMTQAPEQLRKILENVAQAPQFADMVTPQADAADHWQEMLDFQQATAAFAGVMQEAWQRAYQRYSENNSVDDLKSGKVQEALNAWIKSANDELLDTQSSQEFMTAQRDIIKASAALQKRQAKLAESWANAYQMPTRSEVDDLAKMVTELKREVRKLKRENKAAKKK